MAEQRRLAAFQYRDFRLLWFGEAVSTIGSQMQIIAINWHIFEILRDQTFTLNLFGYEIVLGSGALGLGGVGLVRVIPIVIFALLGGVLADALDRRKLMIWTRVIAAILAIVLAVLTFFDQITVSTIYLLTALGAATTAFDSPARQSMVPNLVKPEHLTNAISLNSIIFQVGSIVGPALAGIMVAQFNIGLVYGVNAASFFFAIAALFMIRHSGKVETAGKIGLGALLEGVRFVYNKRIIWGTMLLDFFATFFSSARTMLPIIAGDVLGVGATGYGLLATAEPIGALLMGLFLALRRDIKRQGIVLLLAVGLYGLATALFGISTSFILSYFFFAMIGASDTVSMVIRNTIRQLLTPDHIRGRMASVTMMFFMGGPQLGELEAGVVAAAFGAPFAIFTGGVATILMTVWVAWKFPSLRNYLGGDERKAKEA